MNTLASKVVVALLCSVFCLSASARDVGTIEETITFFYYEDLESAVIFYEEVLGLERTMDEDWVKIFRLSPSSSVGLVKAGHGFHEPSKDKPTMLSIITNDVDSWYEYLSDADVTVLRPLPGEGNDVPKNKAPVRAFVVQDPGGYTVEIFEWN